MIKVWHFVRHEDCNYPRSTAQLFRTAAARAARRGGGDFKPKDTGGQDRTIETFYGDPRLDRLVRSCNEAEEALEGEDCFRNDDRCHTR